MIQFRSRVKLALAVAAGCLGLFAVAAEAQRPYSTQGARTSRTYEAGKFDYYVMSLSWSPSFCSGAGGQSRGNDSQCAPLRVLLEPADQLASNTAERLGNT